MESSSSKRVALMLALLVVVVTVTAFKLMPAESSSTDSGSAAAQLAEARSEGKPVWLLFHSNSCSSCVEMSQLMAKLKGRFSGVAMIPVDVDSRATADQQVIAEYAVRYIPTTVLLTADGQVLYSFAGSLSEDEMTARIRTLAPQS